MTTWPFATEAMQAPPPLPRSPSPRPRPRLLLRVPCCLRLSVDGALGCEAQGWGMGGWGIVLGGLASQLEGHMQGANTPLFVPGVVTAPKWPMALPTCNVLLQDALLQSASNPASIHRGLSVLPATLGAGAGGNPLASGVLKLQLNLRQRLAALHAKQEERDHLFLRRRAQYVSGVAAGRAVRRLPNVAMFFFFFFSPVFWRPCCFCVA